MEKLAEKYVGSGVREGGRLPDTSVRMLAVYFLLAFAITWIFMIPGVYLVPEELLFAFIIPAGFGPFLAAVVTIWAVRGRRELAGWLRGVFRFRIPVSLYLAGAFLLPLLIAGLHFGFYRLLGGAADFSKVTPWYFYLFYLIPTALLTGGNEEPGWRGFALPALLERCHPVVAGLILGTIHSAWHLPMLKHYDTTFVSYLLNLIPLTFILNWFYLRSRRSVFPVMLLHAATNVIAGFIPAQDNVLGGLGDYLSLRSCVYWVMALVLLAGTKGRFGWPATSCPGGRYERGEENEKSSSDDW